jgi:hypothetical protein
VSLAGQSNAFVKVPKKIKNRLAVLRMHIGIRDSSMNGKPQAGVRLAAESRPADSGLPALAGKRGKPSESNPGAETR